MATATKTINLASSCIKSLSNINVNASTGSYYQTGSLDKNGGTLDIAIKINLSEAIGLPASYVKNIKISYDISQERYGVLSSAGTVSTGYKDSGGNVVIQKTHSKGIGKGVNNYEPYTDELTPYCASDNTTTIVMRIKNEINAQTCYYRIKSVSLLIEYNEPAEISDIEMIYGGKQISETNKVPAGEKFIISVAVT